MRYIFITLNKDEVEKLIRSKNVVVRIDDDVTIDIIADWDKQWLYKLVTTIPLDGPITR